MKSLAEALSSMPDHRSNLGKRHELGALLLFLCTGILCGCQSLQSLIRWGKRQEKPLLKQMGLKRGQAAGYGTMQRLVSQLDVDAFEGRVGEWAESVLKALGHEGGYQAVALDGKGLRGSRQGHLPAAHVLSGVAHGLGMTLKQGAVPVSTNDHKASLPLLEGMILTNRVVTADAMFMHEEVCQTILHQQGHYLMVLKENQSN